MNDILLALLKILCKSTNQISRSFRLIVTDKGKPVEKQGRKVSGLRDKTYDSGAARLVFGCSSIEDEGVTMSIEKLFSAFPPKPHPRRIERRFVAIRVFHSVVLSSVVSADNVGATDIVCFR